MKAARSDKLHGVQSKQKATRQCTATASSTTDIEEPSSGPADSDNIFAIQADETKSFANRHNVTANRILRRTGTGKLTSGKFEDIEKNTFKQDAAQIRAKFEKMRRRTINPLSNQIKHWDTIIIFCLTYTAFVTPFEVSFLDDDTAGAGLFACNRIVDTFFIIDMVVTFFLPYRAAEGLGGMWVYDNKKIALHYLKSWFLLDLITCMPFDLIFTLSNGGSSGAGSAQAAVRVLRVLRVIKLVRIVRASRILKRWQDHIGMSNAVLSLVQFVLITMLMSHWLACLWGYAGGVAQHISGDHSRYTRSMVTQGGDMTLEELAEINAELDSYGGSSNWILRARIWSKDPFQLYVISMYVALNNMFGGACEISPGSYNEFCIQCIMLFIGSSVFAYVIGSICGIIATLNPVQVQYRQTMDELNFFVYDQGIPLALAVRLRTFFRNTQHVLRAKKYDELLSTMSTSLWGETSYFVAKRSLQRVPYLADSKVEPNFLLAIAVKLRLFVYSRLEQVPANIGLTVLQRGVAARRGHVMLQGSCLGSDMILTSERLRDTLDSIALTFVQVQVLSRSDFFAVIGDFPGATRVCQRYAFRLALGRLMVKAAEVVKRNPEVKDMGVDEAIKRVLDHSKTSGDLSKLQQGTSAQVNMDPTDAVPSGGASNTWSQIRTNVNGGASKVLSSTNTIAKWTLLHAEREQQDSGMGSDISANHGRGDGTAGSEVGSVVSREIGNALGGVEESLFMRISAKLDEHASEKDARLDGRLDRLAEQVQSTQRLLLTVSDAIRANPASKSRADTVRQKSRPARREHQSNGTASPQGTESGGSGPRPGWAPSAADLVSC